MVMIICINYDSNGDRTIGRVDFVASRYGEDDVSEARDYTDRYDEVYMIPAFNPNYKKLINEVVLNGCRI